MTARVEDFLNHRPLPQALWMVAPQPALDLLARELLQGLLCQEGRACGRCPSCRAWDGTSHPDLLDPAVETGIFDVSMARDGRRDLTLLPVIAPRRVLWVRNADRLLPAAANSLLKITEEPPEQAFILFSGETYHLLPTLQSRTWHLFSPDEVSVEPLALPRGEKELRTWFQERVNLPSDQWPSVLRRMALGAAREGNSGLSALFSELAVEGAAAHLSANQWIDLTLLLLREDSLREQLFDPLWQAPLFGKGRNK